MSPIPYVRGKVSSVAVVAWHRFLLCGWVFFSAVILLIFKGLRRFEAREPAAPSR